MAGYVTTKSDATPKPQRVLEELDGVRNIEDKRCLRESRKYILFEGEKQIRENIESALERSKIPIRAYRSKQVLVGNYMGFVIELSFLMASGSEIKMRSDDKKVYDALTVRKKGKRIMDEFGNSVNELIIRKIKELLSLPIEAFAKDVKPSHRLISCHVHDCTYTEEGYLVVMSDIGKSTCPNGHQKYGLYR